MTLLTAVARSALTNIVAYEAYTAEDAVTRSRLRLQTDLATFQNITFAQGGLTSRYAGLDNPSFPLTASQQTQLSTQLTAMLIEMPSRNMNTELTNGKYVAGNVTQLTLDSLNRTVVKLKDVPAYQLSVDCRADVPDRLTMGTARLGTNIQVFFDNENATQTLDFMTYTYPGVPSDIGGASDGIDTYTYAAFNTNATEVYLGFLTRFNLTNSTGPSTSYGTLEYNAYNMSMFRFGEPGIFVGVTEVMSSYGFRCSIFREEGLLDYTRKETTGSESAWELSDFKPAQGQEKVKVPSFLYHYQGNNLNFHLPGDGTPGIGPALLPGVESPSDKSTFPFNEFPLRYLYASAEVQRIVYEVSALNTTDAHNPPAFFVEVDAVATAQHYRITFVPSLLLAGLLSLILAAIITVAMMAYTWKTTSAQAFRRVDEVRLLVDSVVNLRGNADEMLKLSARSNDAIDAWAAKYKVRYTETDEATIVLRES